MKAPERQALFTALLDAFRSWAALEQFVSFALDENLEAITGRGSLRDVVFRLIDWAEGSNRIPALIRGAREQNPTNEVLLAFRDGDADPGEPSKRDKIRRALAAIYSHVRLIGLPSRSERTTIDLSAVYARPVLHTPTIELSYAELFSSISKEPSTANRAPFYVVFGGPGSGKSTLVSFLAWQSCSSAGGRTPLVFKVAEYVHQERRDGVLDFLADELRAILSIQISTVELTELCRSGDAILLVDGFDEIVDESTRDRLADMLIGFTHSA